jgi:hypothetical protein
LRKSLRAVVVMRKWPFEYRVYILTKPNGSGGWVKLPFSGQVYVPHGR